MNDKTKDMETIDSRVLDNVSGGWEDPDGAINGCGGEPCKPSCKPSDCVLIDTKDGLFWRTNHYYLCKKCGNTFMKGWPLNGADNSLLYK